MQQAGRALPSIHSSSHLSVHLHTCHTAHPTREACLGQIYMIQTHTLSALLARVGSGLRPRESAEQHAPSTQAPGCPHTSLAVMSQHGTMAQQD